MELKYPSRFGPKRLPDSNSHSTRKEFFPAASQKEKEICLPGRSRRKTRGSPEPAVTETQDSASPALFSIVHVDGHIKRYDARSSATAIENMRHRRFTRETGAVAIAAHDSPSDGCGHVRIGKRPGRRTGLRGQRSGERREAQQFTERICDDPAPGSRSTTLHRLGSWASRKEPPRATHSHQPRISCEGIWEAVGPASSPELGTLGPPNVWGIGRRGISSRRGAKRREIKPLRGRTHALVGRPLGTAHRLEHASATDARGRPDSCLST